MMTPKVLSKWINSINESDLDTITSLYASNSILIPTLSQKIRRDQKEIKEYFLEFLSKESLQVEILEFYNQNTCDKTLNISSGIYEFQWVENNTMKDALARFTFITKNEKIIEHHSSLMPNN